MDLKHCLSTYLFFITLPYLHISSLIHNFVFIFRSKMTENMMTEMMIEILDDILTKVQDWYFYLVALSEALRLFSVLLSLGLVSAIAALSDTLQKKNLTLVRLTIFSLSIESLIFLNKCGKTLENTIYIRFCPPFPTSSTSPPFPTLRIWRLSSSTTW